MRVAGGTFSRTDKKRHGFTLFNFWSCGIALRQRIKNKDLTYLTLRYAKKMFFLVVDIKIKKPYKTIYIINLNLQAEDFLIVLEVKS